MLAVLFLAACGGPKNLTVYKENAKSAVAEGNYSVAVESWKTYFEQQAETEEGITGAEYAQAAKTAYKAGMNEQATDWFDQARYKNYADEDMYLTLADIFREQDNLSKELSALEYYRENFSTDNADVNSRLFTLYDEIDMTEKALTIWEKLPDSKKSTKENLEKYFEINKEQENESVVDSVSLELLEMNPDHTSALEWNAMKYYWKAENLYKREMQKYETNKTRSQYRKLLEQLDVVTANFKKSLTYFEKLWEQNPGEKYAPYMANIYARFNDDQKASYYRKFVE
jgi:tetratricopeptide (TPR) repeat protein